MATTLPLIETIKTSTRRDGSVSFAKVVVMLDGKARSASFSCRLDEEPIVIDGDSITIADSQVALLRQAFAMSAEVIATQAAKDAAALDEKLASLDAAFDGFVGAEEARQEIHALYRANVAVAISQRASLAHDRFQKERRAILTRHGLL